MAESLDTTNLPVDDCALLMNFATKQGQKIRQNLEQGSGLSISPTTA